MKYISKYLNLPANLSVTKGIQQPYVFSEEIVIAIDVALATKRPLLVAGIPGSGKSRLAEAVAALLDWNYLSHTMTSRTKLEDLTNEIDYLQRLNDAQLGNQGKEMKPDWAYYKPGIFWWAFQPETAQFRGGNSEKADQIGAKLNYPGIYRKSVHSVLLLDEVDKAEPDLPNDLLEPLDRRSFTIQNNFLIKARDEQQTLMVITTNQERQLPSAFLRRCISLKLKDYDEDRLVTIGKHHYPNATNKLLKSLAKYTLELSVEMKKRNLRTPGTSEFLDAVNTCLTLRIDTNAPEWEVIKKNVLVKSEN